MSQRKGLASLLFVLQANISEFQTEFRKAQREMQQFGKEVQKVGKDLTRNVSLPIAALGAGAVISFRSLNESMKQVEAGIQSTGGAAGFTSEELRKMAKELGTMSNTLNSNILSDVTAQLLTFANVSGDTFERAQVAVLDLSARMKTDLKSSAIMVGKALNDPIQGLTSMRRVGIQFSDAQEEVIRSLMETNRIADAQGVILEELQRQFGGSAEASGDALTGLANDMKMLGQEFGEIIYNGMAPFISLIRQMIQGFSNLSERTKTVVVILGSLAASIGPLLVSIGFFAKTIIPNAITGIVALRGAFMKLTAAMMANPITAVATALGIAAGALFLFKKRSAEATESQKDLKLAIDEVSFALGQQKFSQYATGAGRASDGMLEFSNNLDKLRKDVKGFTKNELESLKVFLNQEYARVSREATNVTGEFNREILNNYLSDYSNALSIVNSELDKFQNYTEQTNQNIQTQVGLIQALSDQIKDLNNARDAAKTEEEIGKINDQIDDLTLKLERLQNVSALAMGKLGENTGVVFTRMQMLPGVITTGIIPAMAQMNTGIDQVNDSITENIDYTETWVQVLKNSYEQIAEGFGLMLGDLVNGGLSFKGMISGLFDMVGDISVQLGRTAIAIGVAVESIKQALKSLSGPVAIAAGVALVGLGKFVKNFAAGLVPKMAGGGEVPPGFYGDKYPAMLSSGEIVVPPRKLEDFLGKFLNISAAPFDVTVNINAKAKGSELLYVVEHAQALRRRNIGR